MAEHGHQGDEVPFTTDVLGHLELKDLPRSPCGRLSERIDTLNFIVKLALGDGNCLFRVVSKILHLTQKLHMKVRKALADEMVKNPEIYRRYAAMVYPQVSSKTAYDEYVKNMYNEGVWGDMVVLYAAANVYRVRAFVLSSYMDEVVTQVAPLDGKYKKDIFLSYVFVNCRNAHYNALFPRSEVPDVIPGCPSPSDKQVVGHQFKVFVGNLPYNVSRADLMNKCSEYGKVSDARVVVKRGRPCGFGFLWMEEEDDMDKVIVGMHGQVWDRKIIRVEKAKGNPYADL